MTQHYKHVIFARLLSTPADTHYVDGDNTTPSAPYLSWETAATNIQNAVDAASSNDTVLVTNGVYDAGGATTPNYSCMNRVCITNAITLESVNGSGHTFIVGEGPAGSNAVRGVYMSAGTLSGFTVTNGHTMASGELDFGHYGGGVHCTGGSTVQNCIIVGNQVHGNKSYDQYGGAAFGGGVYCSGDSTVQSCIISNNSAHGGDGENGVDGVLGSNGADGGHGGDAYGGGIHCEGNSTVQNCIIVNNSAEGGTGGNGGIGSDYEPGFGGPGDGGDGGNGGHAYGGGVSYGAFENCNISDNWAGGGFGGEGNFGGFGEYGPGSEGEYGDGGNGSGGGSSESTLVGCTVSDNSAFGGEGGGFGWGSNGYGYGGGSYYGTLDNCIVYHNSAMSGDYDNYYQGMFSHSCTTPEPLGAENITDNPLFVDVPRGNYRLMESSPCINTGNIPYVEGDTDLDGNPRIMGISVDMGAYEFYAGQGDYDEDGLPNDWEALYYGNILNGDTNALCANGVNTVRQAYIAGLNPTNPASCFELSNLRNILQWEGVSGRVYSVWWTSNLLSGDFLSLGSNIPWTGNIFTDTTYNAEDKGFYRVDVQMK